ncbi:MAG: ribosome silencing factor [Phycisphaerae bacterium]|nr:ribosome silencing factor [Phycisphaerae bacterium]
MPKKQARAKQAKRLAVTTAADAADAVRPPPSRPNEAACRFAVECARLMDADHCEDILLLDLRGVSPVCDYFLIATGTSDRQMRAVGDHIKEMGKAQNETPYGIAGYDEGAWIVLDYVDVVIHLFDAEQRAYYDLESLWGDCPNVEWATSL